MQLEAVRRIRVKNHNFFEKMISNLELSENSANTSPIIFDVLSHGLIRFSPICLYIVDVGLNLVQNSVKTSENDDCFIDFFQNS